MVVRFTKAAQAGEPDILQCVRPDGSTTRTTMPREAVLPPPAIYFVIETCLGWHDAFFGLIAAGRSLDELAGKLEVESPTWSRLPQAQQAAALVDCLQAEQWAGAADPASFAQNLITACRRRGVPPPDVNPEELARLRLALREFGAAWRPLPPGGSLERNF